MIKIRRNFKGLEEILKEPKNEKKPEKQSNSSTCENGGQLVKFLKLKFASPLFNLRKFSQPVKAPPGTRVPFRKFNFKFRSL